MPPAFQGQRATYVALASLTTLGLALLSSIWASDVSGSIAVMGLFAIYLASSDLLLLVCLKEIVVCNTHFASPNFSLSTFSTPFSALLL